MAIDQLPRLLYSGTAIVVFASAVGLAVGHTVLAALAAQRASVDRRRRIRGTAGVGLYLVAWLGLAAIAGDPRNFPLYPEAVRPLVGLLVGFGPMLAAIALLFASRTLRALNAAMAPAWLVWAQTYRVAGLMFFYPLLAYGIVPAGFAIPAGVGDFITGALAPAIGTAVARRRPHAVSWAIAWNVFGILDLIAAPVAAVLSGTQVLGMYPVSLVPLFVGPPLGILAHVYSLRNLALNRDADVGVVSRAVPRTTPSLGDALGTNHAPTTS